MAYFLAALTPYSDYPSFLDEPRKDPFLDTQYEEDTATLDLNMLERHYLDKGRGASMSHGFRVKEESLPKKVMWGLGKRALPEALGLSCYAFSERFRDLVEKFEPGVHQFIPVDVYVSKKGDPVARYYWLNVCNRIDSLDREKTTYKWRTNTNDWKGSWTRLDLENAPSISQARAIEGAKIVVSRKQTRGKHLWFDPFLYEGILCSSEFGEAALAGKFLGLGLSEREEV